MSGFYSSVLDWQQAWHLQREELLNQLCIWLWEALPDPPPYSILSIWQNMPAFSPGQSQLTQALQDPICEKIKQGLSAGNPMERLHRLAEICERSAINSDRKAQGIFYTPHNLATFMVSESLDLLDLQKTCEIQQRSILDPACGAGRLLWQVLWQRIQHAPQAKLKPWVKALLGVDLDVQALFITAFGIQYLWQIYARQEGDCPPLRLYAQDALESDATDLVLAKKLKQTPLLLFISNPPYVGEKNNQQLFLKLKKGYWQKHYRGRGDLYYYFFHLALDLAQHDSVACLLTPAYFTQATAAEYLRQRLKNETHLSQCVDFSSWRVFQQAQGLQSFLCFFKKRTATAKKHPLTTRVYNTKSIHFQTELPLQAQLANPQEMETHKLFQDKNHRIHVGSEHWHFQDYFQNSPKLSDFFHVKQGLVSGADKVSQRHLKRLTQEGKQIQGLQLNQGIFVLEAPEYERLKAEQQVHCPLVPWFKNSNILAFRRLDNPQKLIYAGRGNTLPRPYIAHLEHFKDILLWRREVQLERIPWWQLQWPRTPELFENASVVLPQRAKRLRAALSPGGAYASADVYFIQPQTQKKAQRHLQELCLLLNAPLLSYWFYHWGKRKGAMLEIYQEPLCAVPMPPDFGQVECKALWQKMSSGHLAQNLPLLHDWACRRFQVPEDLAREIWQWSTVIP